jgi:hypothetical protein
VERAAVLCFEGRKSVSMGAAMAAGPLWLGVVDPSISTTTTSLPSPPHSTWKIRRHTGHRNDRKHGTSDTVTSSREFKQWRLIAR